MKVITIETEFIRLQDLLKFASLVSTGGEAKILIAEGRASVNGQACGCEPCRLRGASPSGTALSTSPPLLSRE